MDIEYLMEENTEFKNMMSYIADDIKNRFVIRKINANEILVEKDEEVKSLYLLYSGSMRIINEFDNGYIYSYADIGLLDIVGDIEVLSGNLKFASTVKSISDSILVSIGIDDFINMFENDHNFSKEVAKMLARKMYPSSYERGNFIYYSVEYSLTKLILQLVEEELQVDDISKISMNRVQMSEKLATSVRSVNRVVKNLRECGYITIVKGKISVNHSQYKDLKLSLEKLK